MRRDARAFLWDARDSSESIAEFVKGRTLDEYLVDRMLRSAVERQFEIIGEALNRLSKVSPHLAGRFPELPQVVAFRNLLIHGCAVVDDATVWRFVHENLPDLWQRIDALLKELEG